MSVLDFMKKAVLRATGKKAGRTGLRRVGVSKKHDTCDLCGKTDLKETVVMEGADGARVYYGSECASDGAMGRPLAERVPAPFGGKTWQYEFRSAEITKAYYNLMTKRGIKARWDGDVYIYTDMSPDTQAMRSIVCWSCT